MKKIEAKKIDFEIPLPPEKQTEYNINIQTFDESSSWIELQEEIDNKLISYIEREVRNSFEYKAYVNYLKNELDLTKCALLPGIDIKQSPVSLEFHHFPFNLYEISEIVLKKMLSECQEGEKVSCFDVAERVVREHYLNHIGLVPLTKTIHEMAHQRSIIIPASKINGNYKAFIKEYEEAIDKDILDRIIDIEMTSESDDAILFNKTKLEKDISIYNVKYED